MSATPTFLVLTGDGINCEKETALAFRTAGAEAVIVHINDLLDNPQKLATVQGLAFPGGFSFGDELGSGQVLALKLKHSVLPEIIKLVAKGLPVIGICNGFQVLVKLGLLPHGEGQRAMALAPNRDGYFIDRWVHLSVDSSSVCHWTKGIAGERLQLPIRHGEGRVVFAAGKEVELYQELSQRGQIPLKYMTDLNGSYQRIAAICDPTGLVFGLMPHPEAALFNATFRQVHSDPLGKGEGFSIFSSIVDYLKSR